MNTTINSLKELVERLAVVISNAENEIKVADKFDKKVILYIPTKPKDLFYGMTENDINQVSSNANGIKNIIPTPNPSVIKVMTLNDSLIAYNKLRSIRNGNGETYMAEIVPYRTYLEMYIEEMKKSYEMINDMF